MAATTFTLGIDLGTTSVKATLLDCSSRKVHASFRTETEATITHNNKEFALQDPDHIIQALESTLEKFSIEEMGKVTRIAICGQMHGCLFWNRGYVSSHLTPRGNGRDKRINKLYVSDLITWEDGRCSKQFLSTLPPPVGAPLSTGFGCATIFWLTRYEPEFCTLFDCAGTIMDFVVSLLCGTPLEDVVMTTHNAVSWGYYDIFTNAWQTERLQSAGFPVHFLPRVCEPGSIAGQLHTDYHGLPQGTPVGTALGDSQCSVYACLQNKSDAVLNIGTSSQLTVVTSTDMSFSDNMEGNTKGLQVWPFFNENRVTVAASLTGGNALASFVDTLQCWMKDLSVSEIPSKDDIYNRLISSAKPDTTLSIRPTLWGERHASELNGSVAGITSSNTSLGDMSAAICIGIINNLHDMMPKDWMKSCGVQRIVGTGSALVQNELLQKLVEQVWGLPLVLFESTDASYGAALSML